MADTWTKAYEATSARIAAHPQFRQLVREVAVAEQPTGIPRRLAQNSPTCGSWWTRDSRWPGLGGKGRRALVLAGSIATDLDLWPTLPPTEARGRVYGEARGYVWARLRGPRTEVSA